MKLGDTELTKNTDYTVELSDNINAGTAKIKVTGAGTYTGTANGTFAISPKTVTSPTIVLSATSFEYDGAEHYPTVTVKDGTTVIPASEYTVDYQTSSGVTVQIKEKGTYKVVVTDKEGGNYTLSKTTADFEIMDGTSPGDPGFPYPADGDWTYNDEIKIITNSASKVYDGTPLTDVTYRVVGLPSNLSINVIVSGTQTDVGQSGNTIQAYTISNSSKEDVTSHFTQITCTGGILKVTPAALTVTTGSANKEYDGEPLTCNEASISGLIEGQVIKVTATGSQTNAGSSKNTYTIDWGTTNQRNYTVTENLGMLTVEKAKPQVTVTEAPYLRYTGEPQALLSEAKTTGGTLKMYIDNGPEGSTSWSTEIPKGTKAGQYPIKYRVFVDENSNYEEVSLQTKIAVIGPKEVKNPTIELSATSFTYDGSEHKPTVTVKDGETKLTEGKDYTIAYQKGGATATEFKAAGTYIVVISSIEGSNYIVNGSKTFEIVNPQKKDPEVTVTGATYLRYTGQPQQLLSVATTSGGTLKFGIASFQTPSNKSVTTGNTGATAIKWSPDIPTGTDAGTYTIAYRVAGDNDYNSVDKKELIVVIKGVNFKKNPEGGVTITGGDDGVGGGGTIVIPSSVPGEDGAREL